MTEHIKFNLDLPVPNHIAFIMDGNGRWAQERSLKRTEGHLEGLKALRRVTIAAAKIGVKAVTAYAFSTENWKRPATEVNYLMSLPKVLNDEILPELIENNVRVEITGNLNGTPKMTQRYINNALNKTKDNDGLILNIAFNYGSRNEIMEAVKKISAEVQSGDLKIAEITENTISQHLMTAHLGEMADPDLLVRSSGEVRLSNFLLWQVAYSEMYFSPVYWPDFNEEVLLECIAYYQQRDRRFGGIKTL